MIENCRFWRNLCWKSQTMPETFEQIIERIAATFEQLLKQLQKHLNNCWNNCRNIWTIVETIVETFEQLLKQLQKHLNNCWNNCRNIWYKFKCSPCNPSPEAFWKHSKYIIYIYIYLYLFNYLSKEIWSLTSVLRIFGRHEVPQQRSLTAKRSHSKEVSQQREPTAKRSHSKQVPQQRSLIARKSWSKEISQQRGLTAKKFHSKEISQQRSPIHLQLSDFVRSLAPKLRFRIFNFQILRDVSHKNFVFTSSRRLAPKLRFHIFNFQILRELSCTKASFSHLQLADFGGMSRTKALFSHLQGSDFEGCLAPKLSLHIFNLQILRDVSHQSFVFTSSTFRFGGDVLHQSFVFTSSTFRFWGSTRTKASFSHLQLSDFQGGLAPKLRFQILFRFWEKSPTKWLFLKVGGCTKWVFCRTKRVWEDGWGSFAVRRVRNTLGCIPYSGIILGSAVCVTFAAGHRKSYWSGCIKVAIVICQQIFL